MSDFDINKLIKEFRRLKIPAWQEHSFEDLLHPVCIKIKIQDKIFRP